MHKARAHKYENILGCICVCLHVCVYMYVCVGACVCVLRGLLQTLEDSFSSTHHTLVWHLSRHLLVFYFNSVLRVEHM